MDSDNPKVYGDTSITDGLVFNLLRTTKKVNMKYDLPEDTDEIFLRRVIHGTVLAAFFI